MCVYNVLYISIGIYKISTAKKRENRTQKEYTHSQSKAQSNTTKKREHRQEKQGHTRQRSTQHAADCRTMLIQFFRRGSVADSRLFTISGAFARFCEFSKAPRKPPSARPRPSNSSHLCNNGQR